MLTVKYKSQGTVVQLLQQELNAHGFAPGAQDGIFGKSTLAAVKAFQKANKVKVDGIVGEDTWKLLLKPNATTPANYSTMVPYYSQKDPRWATVMYSSHGDRSQTIASSGCGPTSMAMIISWFSAIKPTIPTDMAKLAIEGGYRTENSGTDWGFFHSAAKKYLLSCEQTYSLKEVITALLAGKKVIANMGPGYFTKGGHYIVLTGTKGSDILVNDPASKERNKGSLDIFKAQAKVFFIFDTLN